MFLAHSHRIGYIPGLCKPKFCLMEYIKPWIKLFSILWLKLRTWCVLLRKIWVYKSQEYVRFRVSVAILNTGRTSHTIIEWCKERQWYIRLGQFGMSTLSEYCIDTGHKVVVISTSRLFGAMRFWDGLILESVAIQGSSNTLNRDIECHLEASYKTDLFNC